jgi:hypothetical protein
MRIQDGILFHQMCKIWWYTFISAMDAMDQIETTLNAFYFNIFDSWWILSLRWDQKFDGMGK